MIEALRLGIVSRGATLWDGIDLAFEDGTATVIAGPPSCGKTLLLSVLRGGRRPDAGDVLVSGESVYRMSGSAARSFRASGACVPERPEFDERLTVNGLFSRSSLFCGQVSGRERDERRERLLAMVGLTGKEGARISALSSSERVLAVLAAELLRNPKILFADGTVQSAGEPHAEMLGNLYRALAGAGSTVVAAERKLPDRWEAFAGQGKPAGPFLIYRLPPIGMKGGSD